MTKHEPTGLLIGGPVWGEAYADVFERYCLATMRAPANLAALQANDASIEIYTDEDTWGRIEAMLEGCGIPFHINLIRFTGTKYDILTRVHSQQVEDCAKTRRPFHMLVCDQVYSESYFPNLFRLAAEHGNLIHSGVNCTMSGAAAELDTLRAKDGSIAIDGTTLGHITWKHRHNRLSQFVMNDGEGLPNCHFHIWRARDRAMMFCAHNSPVYLTPETGEKLGRTQSTLDSMAHLIGDFHAPSLEDDMVLSGVEVEPKIQWYPRVDWHQFAINCWDQAKSAKSISRYYRRPSAEVAIPIDEDAPTAAEVIEKQTSICERLIDYGCEQDWPPVKAEHRVAANG